MDKKKLMVWAVFFLIFFAAAQLMSKKNSQPAQNGSSVSIAPAKQQYAVDEEVILTIKNPTAETVSFKSNCPVNPFNVLMWTGEKFEAEKAESKINCELAPDFTVTPGGKQQVSYTYWNHSLFGAPGRFKIETNYTTGSSTASIATSEFEVVKAGFWRKTFRTIFYQPIYNVLVLSLMIAPMRDLGFAIIILTIIIRLILLIPSQRAIVSQRRLQEVQPLLEKIKKQYAGNQERIAHETMKLWKENKINPFGSCLPIVVQFPVLIALFYVVKNGLNPDNVHYLYGPLKNIDFANIHTNFLGVLDLTRINTFVLPLIVGALQFLQLKLTMLKKPKVKDKDQKPEKGSEMEAVNNTMIYIMPVMIAVFTASVPAGVGLYWGVSTLFAIGQQMIANRKKQI